MTIKTSSFLVFYIFVYVLQSNKNQCKSKFLKAYFWVDVQVLFEETEGIPIRVCRLLFFPLGIPGFTQWELYGIQTRVCSMPVGHSLLIRTCICGVVKVLSMLPWAQALRMAYSPSMEVCPGESHPDRITNKRLNQKHIYEILFQSVKQPLCQMNWPLYVNSHCYIRLYL